ncbi:MAG: DUF3088 domain-containing protein [Bacillota bacterium]|nr:DUF3088 domain-containing protein [Bacillota bacterium]
MKDQLYLLKPGFFNQEKGPFFCPGCAYVEGMLSFYPELRDKIEVHYLDFPRPRQVLVALIGADNQGAPKLVLGDSAEATPEDIVVHTYNDKKFIADPREICKFLAAKFGVGTPH